jgi:hypothetical protein
MTASNFGVGDALRELVRAEAALAAAEIVLHGANLRSEAERVHTLIELTKKLASELTAGYGP